MIKTGYQFICSLRTSVRPSVQLVPKINNEATVETNCTTGASQSLTLYTVCSQILK